jgi:hypothetical protein
VVAKYDEWLTEEGLLLIEGWARDGLVDEQIAYNMGITSRTLRDWKNKFPSVSSALKKGKEVVDRQVENAMLKSALGFHYQEEAVTNKGEVVSITKFEKPNTTAQIFWLKNRKPDTWRDKQEIKHEGEMSVTFIDDIGEEDET